MSERFAWTPLTDDELDEMSGLAEIKAKAAGGDRMAQLVVKRIEAVADAMAPFIAEQKAQIEREWLEGLPTCPDGLALLLGPDAAPR